MRNIIAVLGATGAQGGGLVRAILNDPERQFDVHAITRNTNSEKAKALGALGARLVQADLDDVDSLKSAFAGAYGVFAVTNFWEHFSGEKEILQATNIAQAAKAADVKHVIWSTLEDTRELTMMSEMPTLQGRFRVPHFDAKAEANKAFRDYKVPTTNLVTSFFYSNFTKFFIPTKVEGEDRWTVTVPMDDAKLPCMAVEDVGQQAYRLFKMGDKMMDDEVGIVGDRLTMSQICKILTEELCVQVDYNEVDADTFRSFGFPGADECGNMFQVYHECQNQVMARRFKLPGMTPFREWVRDHKAELKTAMQVPESIEA